MSLRIVRLGSPRASREALRIGVVRYPPRGVLKSLYGEQNWFDVWFPTLAPTNESMKLARRAKTDAEWTRFTRLHGGEMSGAHASHAPNCLRLCHTEQISRSDAIAPRKIVATDPS